MLSVAHETTITKVILPSELTPTLPLFCKNTPEAAGCTIGRAPKTSQFDTRAARGRLGSVRFGHGACSRRFPAAAGDDVDDNDTRHAR